MTKRLHVLVLAQYFFPDMGGASTRATNVVKGLLSNNCNVTVVSAFPHYPLGHIPKKYNYKAIASERFLNAKLIRVWVPSLPHSSPLKRIFLHFCFCVSCLFALPYISKVNIVWCANPNLFSFFPGVIYSAIKGVPIARNVDDLWPEVFYELGYVKSKFAQKILDFLAWLSYVVPIVITPISEGYKRTIVTKYGISSEKLHVIKVGVNRINPLKKFKNSKKQFIVMYSGILGLGYDFNIVLDAANILKSYENIFFIIRGNGESADELEKTINERGLRNVVLDRRFLPENELANMLESADIFLLPMASMNFVDLGLPTKVFEYQAFGKPIICVSGGEAAKYIESTNSGLIVKPKDANGFAEALISLYDNKEKRKELGLNGRKYVLKNLTAQKIGERVHNLFFSVIS
jgi:glycosyltransferase involved in cell wall biosynthesis